MDYTNNSKDRSEVDVRAILNYLLSKIWIIALVAVGFAVVSFLYTTLFVTPLYTSTSSVLILSNDPTVSTSGNWSIAKQYVTSGPAIITLDFCDQVADDLNSNSYDCSNVLGDDVKFSDYYKSVTGKEKISGDSILDSIKVSPNEKTCVVDFKVTTEDAKLSAIIANVISSSFESRYKSIIDSEYVRTSVTNMGRVSDSPSNIHKLRNVVLATIIGLVAVCAVLTVIFMFDDKIKTPDDVEKQLKLSVLGTIPETESEA